MTDKVIFLPHRLTFSGTQAVDRRMYNAYVVWLVNRTDSTWKIQKVKDCISNRPWSEEKPLTKKQKYFDINYLLTHESELAREVGLYLQALED